MPAISTPLAKGSSTSSLRVGRARLSDGNTIVPTAHASLALALARTSQPLPPCQQQEGKEEHEARKVDRAGEGGGRVRIGRHRG
jgi:hypothetical protein